MVNFRVLIKRAIFPIMPMTLFTALGIILSVKAIYNFYTYGVAIYLAVLIPITLVLIALYILDRLLVRKIHYIKLMLGELVIAIIVYLLFSFQSKTTDINYHGNQDYFLIVFNSKENSLSKFSRKGLFGKELNVYDTNIINLDIGISLQKDLRINAPKQWDGFIQNKGIYKFEGDSIAYIFVSKQPLSPNNKKHSQTFIDSLLNEVKRN